MMKQQEQVKQFHLAFGHPVSDKPISLTMERAKARMDWVIEEVNEYLEAVEKGDVVGQADALTDAMYFILGTADENGIDLEPIFDIVQNANMAKLFPDGKPRYRESDGKVIKPEVWVAPEPQIQAEIERQMNSEINHWVSDLV